MLLQLNDRTEPAYEPSQLPAQLTIDLYRQSAGSGRTQDDQVRYIWECLQGYRLPDPQDVALQAYCKEHYRMREWIELYKRLHVAHLKQPSPMLCRLRKWFVALLDIRPRDLTKQAVLQWYTDNRKRSETQAGESLKSLRSIYFKMIAWGIHDGVNPTDGFRKTKPLSRTRFIQPGGEMDRLHAALSVETDQVQTFFYLCLLVACRGKEARSLRWADLDVNNGLWHKPTTKNGTPQSVCLPEELVTRLKALPRCGVYVFSSPRSETHWPHATTYGYWQRIRTRAELADVTIHDLRRTWASWAAMKGQNLAVIGAVLNHKDLSSTQIYARLNTRPIYAAVHDLTRILMANAPEVVTPNATAASRPQPTPPLGREPIANGQKEQSGAEVVSMAAKDQGMEWPG